MIYYTGDIHGLADGLIAFSKKIKLDPDDILVLLGDVGANFFGGYKDRHLKEALQALGPTIFCIHGNHERRPQTLPSYLVKEWHGGQVFYEVDFPNLLFARDGEIFDLGGRSHLVLGGAYSVDKAYRIKYDQGWWPDEQPSEEIKAHAVKTLEACNWKVDTVLSHTCPFKYIPREAFLPMINQDNVDNSTERWLDDIEDRLSYEHWLCGHWHINKRIDKMHFLFHDVETIYPLKKK